MKISSVTVVGGGPGGYAAALEATRRGFTVTIIDRQEIGGTCLNRGCIPSKFFLGRAKRHAEAAQPGNSLGTRAEAPQMSALLSQKNEVVGTIRGRMEQALKTQKIRRLTGRAQFVSPTTLQVTGADGTKQDVTSDAIILATGTAPVRPSSFPVHPAIVDSTGILDLTYQPDHLVVLGGGYIGCELACAFHGLGSRVTLIEKEATLLATQPEFSAAASLLQRSFEKRGLTVWTGTEATQVEKIDDRRVRIRGSNGQTVEADAFLLALGRLPDVKELALEKAGLALEGRRLPVNNHWQTKVPSIFAIGDLSSPVPLAHAAAREGELVAAYLAGEDHTIDYAAIPRCVYTWPEAAAVGLTEDQARQAGHQPRIDRYHFAASAKALIEEEAEGYWLIVSDSSTGKILGGQVVGAHATELIHLLSLSIKAGFRVQDIANTVFAHPSLSEGFQEAMSRALKSGRVAKPQ